MDASQTGDLLFAALILRTMCEEVQRLHALNFSADQLANLAKSAEDEDQKHLSTFIAVAWTSLDQLPSEMMIEGTGWPKLTSISRSMPDIETARAALNSYVHPNYGSHIAALFPESASAATILLKAVVEVYRAFFALPWSELPIKRKSCSPSVGSLKSLQNSSRKLASKTLPDVRRHIKDETVLEAFKVENLLNWLNREDDRASILLNSEELNQFLSDLPRRPDGRDANEASHYLMWAGARASDVLQFAVARQTERRLQSDFPIGAPTPDQQENWLNFNAISLQLAVSIDQIKAEAFRVQLVRQIEQENPIGVWLCVRSLIEHRALIVWVSNQVGLGIDAIVPNLKASTDLPDMSSNIIQPITNFLAAQAAKSKEDKRAWVMEEKGVVRTAWLNLKVVVEGGFSKDDRLHTIYALASAVLHGRLDRGISLSRDLQTRKRAATEIGLLVLDRLCDNSEEMDHISVAFTHAVRLSHAAEVGGTAIASSDAMARKIFGHAPEYLEFGTDYTGKGTVDEPFCIAKHLQFHSTSYALLRQMGGDPSRDDRLLEYDSDRNLCDHWTSAHRDFWFRLNI